MLNKEKNKLKDKDDYIPTWIAGDHWADLKRHWDSDQFKMISRVNARNRVNNPSLHTGGSLPSHEHAKKLEKDTGKRPMLSQLYLANHKKKKDNQWVDEKAKNAFVTYKRNLVAASSGDVAEEKQLEDIPADLAEVALQDEQPDEDLAETEASLPIDQVAETWVKAASGMKRTGKVYGLGSHFTTIVGNVYLNSSQPANPPSSQVPPAVDNLVGTPAFEQAVDHAVEQRMSQLRLSIQQDIYAAIRSLGDKNMPPPGQHDGSSHSSRHPDT